MSEALQNEEEILLSKIKKILQDTDPLQWMREGRPLKENEKFSSMRVAWHNIVCIPLNDALLVVRCSLPVRSDFLGGGFTLTPTGAEDYIVEMRAKGWNPRELTDPDYRIRAADRRCDVLAEGRVAKSLYEFIIQQHENSTKDEQRKFEKIAHDFIAGLVGDLKRHRVNWMREDTATGGTHLHGTIAEYQVDAYIEYRKKLEFHGIRVSRDGMSYNCTDRVLAKQFYQEALGALKTSNLVALHSELCKLKAK